MPAASEEAHPLEAWVGRRGVDAPRGDRATPELGPCGRCPGPGLRDGGGTRDQDGPDRPHNQ